MLNVIIQALRHIRRVVQRCPENVRVRSPRETRIEEAEVLLSLASLGTRKPGIEWIRVGILEEVEFQFRVESRWVIIRGD